LRQVACSQKDVQKKSQTLKMDTKTDRENFFSGVLVLTVSNLLVKAAGMFFKLPMNYIVGDTGMGYYGTANYYVYVIGGLDHSHQIVEEAQTVEDPITGYCGNIQTTLYVGEKAYTFQYGYSVTLTDILVNLRYDPMGVCRCAPEYTVDTEFGTGYGINLTQGYARCEKGQANLTQEQINAIAQIVAWAESTNGEYDFSNS